MKSIKDLNQKVWYRTLKVLYIIFFVSTFSISVYAIFDTHEQKINSKESYILCRDNKKILINESNSKSSIGSNIGYMRDEEIDNICFANISAVTFSPDYPNTLKKLEAKNLNYQLVIVYERYWSNIIAFILFAAAINLFVFELIKRIFYYIILGKIIPEKN